MVVEPTKVRVTPWKPLKVPGTLSPFTVHPDTRAVAFGPLPLPPLGVTRICAVALVPMIGFAELKTTGCPDTGA